MDAKSDVTEVEAFMREYNDLFSSGDARALWSRVYRFEPGGKAMINSEADLKKLHDDIVAQGYSHSIIHMMKVTPTGPDLMRVKRNGFRVNYFRVTSAGRVASAATPCRA